MSKRKDPTLATLSERVAKLEESNKWIIQKLENLERRTWQVLASVIAFGIISIIIAIASSLA